MPSPRPSGSGVWKILPLPHGLKNQVLHLIVFLSYSLQLLIGVFFCSGPLGVCVCGSCLAPFPLDCGLSFLEAITSEVSILLTMKTLYSPHVPLFFLPSNVPLSRGEGRHGRLVFMAGSRGTVVTGFGSVGSSSIRRGVHGVWVAFSVRGGPGVVEL